MDKYMLGIDIGTTNIKAVVYTYNGDEKFSVAATYALHTDEKGAATQNIEEIRDRFFEVIREITLQCERKKIALEFMSLSTAMHSLLLVDEEKEALTPLITWADSRSRQFAEKVRKKERIKKLYERTGTPIHSMSPLIKLLWLQEEYPDVYRNAAKFVDLKSYLIEQLVGEYLIDYSLANGTGLFNIETMTWDEEALSLVNLKSEKLPKAVPTTEVLRELKADIARRLDLPVDFPIIVGASDGCLANLGVGVVDDTQLALSIGTSGALRTVVSEPVANSDAPIFCYYLTDQHWVIGGAVNNGGSTFDWAKDKFMADANYEEVMAEIENSPPGAMNLFFYPYLMGERAPFWNEKISGSFFGLRMHHTTEHLLRAVLEGINLNLYTVYQTIKPLIHKKTKQIHVTGGFIQSEIWLQMLADIFGMQLLLSHTQEKGCFGAAILGLYSLGEIETLQESARFVKIVKVINPNKERHAFYKKHFEKYTRINKKLYMIYEEEWK